jgi:hypothetical protein
MTVGPSEASTLETSIDLGTLPLEARPCWVLTAWTYDILKAQESKPRSPLLRKAEKLRVRIRAKTLGEDKHTIVGEATT